MNLEDIVLRKVSHRRTHTALFHLHKASKIVKIIEGRTVVSRGWGGRNGKRVALSGLWLLYVLVILATLVLSTEQETHACC